MTLQETFKKAHLEKESKRWDEAVENVRRLLTDREKNIRALTYRLLSIDHMTRYYVLGGEWYMRRGVVADYTYGPVYEVCGLLEFIHFFVGHEILDDGDPAVAYYRSTDNGPVLVNPNEVDDRTKVFFHRSHEVLAKTYGWENTEHLHEDNALAILNDYERKRARKMRRVIELEYDHMRGSYEMNAEDRALAAFAREEIAFARELGRV